NCGLYRPEEFKGYSKIEVRSKSGKSILATLNIVEDEAILAADTLGLSTTAFRHLGVKCGAEVKIYPAVPPSSLDHVRAKIYGETLKPAAIREIVADIAAYRYSRMEIAAFLVSCAAFMTVEEVYSLTTAMAEVGTRLDWDHGKRLVVDKHCVGGLPGNRTSMIIVPVVAAYGLTIPKTSSRAITSPAGTADTMETLAQVDLPLAKMKSVVEHNNGCLIWGGKVNLSPADDIMISVERPLGIDTPEQMVASILSKKIAAGSTHLVIDIPVGPTAKVRNRKEAMRLRKLFEHIGKRVGLVVDIMITDGTQPVGRGIGPLLEARDVMAVLRGEENAPRDLRERALLLSSRILEFDPGLPGGQGYETARAILDSRQALAKMEAIINDQGQVRLLKLGKLRYDVLAKTGGTIKALDCSHLANIARAAGAPLFKGSGVDLYKKVGDKVKKGEALYRVYSGIKADFEFAKARIKQSSGVEIG
ncbi:MAG: thymidine phosphorylase family protein, partial [Alphaproteobacteria bacterium]